MAVLLLSVGVICDTGSSPVMSVGAKGSGLRVTEVDGSPDVFNARQLKFPNGSLANSVGSVTYTPVAAYKKYVALLSQSGTSAPTATVFENSLGETVVWTRDGVGTYTGTLAGAFPAEKVFAVAYAQDVQNAAGFISITPNSPNEVSLVTLALDGSTGGDDFLSNTPIEIRVYP